MNRPGARPGKRFWPRARRIFRWMRIAALGGVLLAVAVVLWCNYVGVPQALSTLLRTELRRKNLDVEFKLLKLQGISHLIARDLHFASSSSNDLPQLDAASAEVLLVGRKLRRGEIEVSGLRLQNGRVRIPIHRTNEPPRFLTVSNVVADIELLPDDAIRVTQVSAEALGARAQASGYLRHFSKLSISPGQGTTGAAAARWREELREIADILAGFDFEEPPVLSLHVAGDAANLASLRGSVSVLSQSARSDWAAFEKLRLVSGVFPGRTNATVAGSFSLSISRLTTKNGAIGEATLEAESVWNRDLDRLETNSLSLYAVDLGSVWGRGSHARVSMASGQSTGTNLMHTQVEAAASGLEAESYAIGASELTIRLDHALPFPTPAAWFRALVREDAGSLRNSRVAGDWRLRTSGVKLAQTQLDTVDVSGEIRGENLQPASDLSLGFWRHLAPLSIPWRLAVSKLVSEKMSIGSLNAAGAWNFPEFRVDQLDAQLYSGSIAGTSTLDVQTRRFAAGLQGDFDYHSLSRLFDRPVQKWLTQFSWQRPPFVEAKVEFVAPSWTGSWAVAKDEILPTIQLSGAFKGGADFRGIVFDHAEGRFSFSNYVWRIPDLTVQRPEGVTWIDYTGNVTNGAFSCWLDARLDPGMFRSLVDTKARKGFDLVRFPQAPVLVGQASGNWDRPEEILFTGQLAATNFYVRERLVGDVAAEIALSNLVLQAWNVTAHLGTGAVRAPFVHIDLSKAVMTVTNVVSTADPYDAMHIVGPEAYDAIDPYRFDLPPTVRVNGKVDLTGVRKTDLWFEIAGGQFHFWKFNLPALTGTVHWRDNELWITNVNASFYRGRAIWEGYFFIHDGEDRADFRFTGQAQDADLKLLVADLFGMTNQMEGRFSGSLTITSADTSNDKSWNGRGRATLRDGLLWNVPLFGVLTPMLDAVVPGASVSRVTAGAGNFNITNSVIHTKDLQVRTRAFRLNYEGSVDLEGRLDALVVAEIFRDTWLVGKVFSLALWPVAKAFEARISGNVSAPKTQLRYFPRFLLAPFKALGAIGGSNKSGPSEKAPPVQKQESKAPAPDKE